MSSSYEQLIGWTPSVDGVGDARTARRPIQAFLNSPFSNSSSFPNNDSRPLHSSCPSTRRQHEPGWVARPRNAFIVFRCDYSQIHRRKGRRIRRPPGTHSTEPSLSKRAATVWKQMTPEEKEPYRIRAEQERDDHVRNNPDYRFRPQRQPGTGPKSDYRLRSSHKPAKGRKGCPPTKLDASCELSTSSIAPSPTSLPPSTAGGPQLGVDSARRHLSTSSTRWIHPVACNISAAPSDSVEIPAEMMPTQQTAYHFNSVPSCTTTETTCPLSTQPHLFQNGEMSISPIATGTQISSNTLASPLEVADFFASSTFAQREGYYEARQYGTIQYPSYAEGLWYGPTSSYLEPMAPLASRHTNLYDYATTTDYSNSFKFL